MTILDLITNIDTEDELIEVIHHETELPLFEFWTGSYFSDDLDSHKTKVIETYELKGFHLETPENKQPRLVCSVQESFEEAVSVREILNNIYGDDFMQALNQSEPK